MKKAGLPMLKRYLLIILLFVAPFTYAGDGDPVIEGLTATAIDVTTIDLQNTGTLNGLDATDATTESTIEAIIDTLANLTSLQGQTITLSGELHVESATHLNQDLTSDASPTFAGETISGEEGADGVISLNADEGADNADKWRFRADADGGFGIDYYGTGSWVEGFGINSDLYTAYTIRHATYSDSTTQTITSTSVPWAMTFDTTEHETGITKGKTGTVTIDIATPAVVHWAGHGLYVDSPVVFTTDGALPTGITPGAKYYIISAGFGTDSFEISATPQGAAVNTSGSQSGVHTGTNKSVITIASAGFYGFIFSTMCDCTSGNGTTIDIWFRKNGTNVDRSNTRVQIATASNVVISVADIALDLTAGDKIEMFWVGSSTNDQLLAIAAAASPTRPATPSTILTVKKISK